MSTASPGPEPGAGAGTGTRRRPLAAVRIGLVSGLVGILCCVGPTVLALLGVVSAGTAFVWATGLYDGYAWWFRLAGLAVLVTLVWWSLRRKRMCSLDGARRAKAKIALALGVAVATYGVLYGVTTWLGTFA
ncbi:hypothetical protein [Nocardiopsis sp. FIRDI 009]|uniref:hypothetical protein n=1 Tax=Nocardiopsis sp. FIRDI 009 TaxID=714197 RepID=UPI000E266C6D|nr:hypothetical protein [Nocardiopsis sp. FIRDI 009]